MAEDALARARAIAAKLGTITESDNLGKRKHRDVHDVGRKKKKIYIPVEKFPDINFIGLLIGPRGTNQKRMEEESGARILIRGKGSSKEGDRDEHEDLHVLVTAHTDAQIAIAQREVEEILYNPKKALEIKREQLQKVAELKGGVEAGSGHYGPSGGDANAVKIEVPPTLVGFIIGRGGETIRDLQERSGARIHVARESDEDANKPTRTISIGGSKQAVELASKLVNNLLEDRKSGGSHYGPGANGDSIKVIVPNEKVGLIIGRGGETIRGIQQRTTANVQIPRESDSANPSVRTIEISGTKESCEAAKKEIESMIENDTRGSGGVSMKIPNDKVGTIIGRGGETIRGIQDRTGARIQVPHDADPGTHPPVRTISITGTSEAAQYAKAEIEQIVAGSGSGGGYGSSSYGQQSYSYGQSAYGYDQYSQQQQQQYASTASTTVDPNDPNSYWNGYYEYAAYYGVDAANAAWGVTQAADPTQATDPAAADATTAAAAQPPPPPGTT